MHSTIIGLAAITAFSSSMAMPLSDDPPREPSLARESHEVRVEGSEFVVRTAQGTELRGEQVLGLTLTLPKGITVRVDSMRHDTLAPDLFLYDLKARDASSGEWRSMCAPDHEGRQLALPLQGRTDETNGFVADPAAIRLSCTGGALAKCVRYGYRYWSGSGMRDDLVPFYQACVRMIRADYCGDGQPATRPGVLIDIWDDRAADRRPEPIAWQFEAGWTPQGAVCVNHTRVNAIESLHQLVQRCPRLAAASGTPCTEEQARTQGALLFNASPKED
jgi:hypothetical protein